MSVIIVSKQHDRSPLMIAFSIYCWALRWVSCSVPSAAETSPAIEIGSRPIGSSTAAGRRNRRRYPGSHRVDPAARERDRRDTRGRAAHRHPAVGGNSRHPAGEKPRGRLCRAAPANNRTALDGKSGRVMGEPGHGSTNPAKTGPIQRDQSPIRPALRLSMAILVFTSSAMKARSCSLKVGESPSETAFLSSFAIDSMPLLALVR